MTMMTVQIAAVFGPRLAAAGHALSAAFHHFAHAAGPLVFAALWQGAAIACGLALCLRLAPRASAAHRFAVWAAGFAALVCLPFLPVLLSFGVQAARGNASGISLAPARPWLALDARWSLLIGALWLLASTLRALDLGVHTLRLRRLWRSATPVAPATLPARLVNASRRHAQVCTTRQLDRPSVIGFLAPRILIPAWLFARLTPGELEQVVLHECEHLRRGDDWTNLLQKLCLVLFPLNPALAWMERRLCREREMACDDGVIRATQAPRAYAACLTSLAERGLERRTEALSLGAWQRRPELVDRVHRILRRTPALSPLATNALLGVLGCGLIFGSVELARCPQLVAFVPARSTTVRAQLAGAGDEADALIRTDRPPAGFHAVEAMATLPAMRRTAAVRTVGHPAPRFSAPHTPAQTQLPALAANASRQQLRAVQMSPAGVVETQQWIVFTTWDQETTSGAAAQMAQNAPSSPATTSAVLAAKREPAASTMASQITVTRLILSVYPAGSRTQPPAAVPLREGWLVIQL